MKTLIVSMTSALNFSYNEALNLTPKEAFAYVIRYNELNSLDNDENTVNVVDRVDPSFKGVGILKV